MQKSDRVPIPMSFWTGGCNSLVHPSDLPKGQYAWGENIINRGGIIQTRPGQRLIGSILGKKLQGFAVFTPKRSTARLVVAVDGFIYQAKWPNFIFDKIEGVSFSPNAPLINFQECVQSTKRNQSGTISIIAPLPVLIIQDGATAAGYWDGVTARHTDSGKPSYETPTGLWMTWTGGRLWVSQGSQLRASYLGNPLDFNEDRVTATRSHFELPGEITGLIETSDQRGLLCFTESTTSSFQSQIHDRTEWQQTKDFQRLVFPKIGCIAGRTCCNQYGLTHWYCEAGFISLDAAKFSQLSSKLQTTDGEMMRSKRNLSPDMSGACAVDYDNLLLVSVPSGSKYNAQTWVMDQTPLDSNTPQQGGSAWAGIWTGTRPVQWAQGKVGGRKRIYFASYDRTPLNDTHIHIWEAMMDKRTDADGRIYCQFQTGFATGTGLMSFKFAEIEVIEMLGKVKLDVFVSGTRGQWFSIGTFEMRAEEGSIGAPGQRIIQLDSILQAFKPQSRTIRTKEFTSQGKECSPEMSNNVPGKDKGFSLLFEWRGRMGIREIKLWVKPESESESGKCSPSEEGKVNMVNEQGEVVEA